MAGLVLEGGGMRSIFTAGVLDFFLEENIEFPYLISLSAGAMAGASYIAKQKGRDKEIILKYSQKYLNKFNLIKKSSIFDDKILFDEIPNKLIPFDYDEFYKSKTIFKTYAVNCLNGNLEYFEKSNIKKENLMKVLQASISLPFLTKIVKIENIPYLDGGIIDPLPIKKSILDGNKKNILILTRNKEYKKKEFNLSFMAKFVYHKYPKIYEYLKNRHNVYNETLDFLEEEEKSGNLFIIRPQKKLEISRLGGKIEKMENLYFEGYEEAKKNKKNLINFLQF